MFRYGYTRPGAREHEGSAPQGLNPGHSMTLVKHPPSVPARKLFPWTHQMAQPASLPQPDSGQQEAVLGIFEETRATNSGRWRVVPMQCLHTHIPSSTSKLSSTIPTCWVWDYITPASPEPLLSALVTVDTSAELSGIYFLA